MASPLPMHPLGGGGGLASPAPVLAHPSPFHLCIEVLLKDHSEQGRGGVGGAWARAPGAHVFPWATSVPNTGGHRNKGRRGVPGPGEGAMVTA